MKRCKSDEDVLTTLRSFDKEDDRPLDTINLSALFTILPRVSGNKQTKLQVAREVAADVDHQLSSGFLHPNVGNFDPQGPANVAWGLIQVGLANQQ